MQSTSIDNSYYCRLRVHEQSESAGTRPMPEPIAPAAQSLYLSSLDMRRSASSRPSVWQVGQYWNDLSAKEISRTVSPHTGHGNPARACTFSPDRFSPFSLAACWPTDRATASGVSFAASLKGESLAACRISSEYALPMPARTA